MTENSNHGKPKKRGSFATSSRLVILGFAFVILVGTGLLLLPFSTKEGVRLSFVDAIFTATSATCVTGLVVANTFETFTGFGQVVILLLIQIGGLGFMTVYSALFMIVGKRFSLQSKLSLRDTLAQIDLGEVRGLLMNIVKLTCIIESVGAVVLTAAFSRYYSFGTAVWKGIFHSIAAFCNAGFDIIDIGDGSLTAFNSDPIILLTISILIILGGLGFIVIGDVLKKKRLHKTNIHTKIVLTMTSALLAFGTVLFLCTEYNNPTTIGGMNFGDKLLNSFFLSTTCRTAGFNSVAMNSLSRVSIPAALFLMFIGASPASTGGGIKTTTLFILIMAIGTTVLRQKETVVGYKKIGQTTQTKAVAVFMLAFVLFALSYFALVISEPTLTPTEIIFEQVSAYATVGLSLGITAKLSIFGKLIMIVNMFLGRLGALTFLLAFSNDKNGGKNKIQYPEANINI